MSSQVETHQEETSPKLRLKKEVERLMRVTIKEMDRELAEALIPKFLEIRELLDGKG